MLFCSFFYSNVLQSMLRDDGIDTKIHYPIPLHKQKCFVNEFGDLFFPNVESFASQILASDLSSA